jgi:thiamine biosynthesis protein ThiI
MHEVVLVQYDEIALKRGRRPYYEKRLSTGIENAVRDLGRPAIRASHGRVVVTGGKTEIPAGVLMDRLTRVFGVSAVLRGFLTTSAPEAVAAAALRAVAERPDARSFGVRVRKAPRTLTATSTELAAALGAVIGAQTRMRVDLRAPDLWLDVIFLCDEAFVSGERLPGPGGLPVGTSGRGVALLSGGIDSPVAAWLMMGRGLKISIVHFHSAPFTTPESQEKVRHLVRLLARYQPTIDVAFIPFADLQRSVTALTPPPLRVILYRRFMVRIAEVLARAVGAGCLVTGDALAQVASQTVENLGAIDAAASMPIFRPLVGMSKKRIIDEARRLGTYEVSILPHDDCCGFLLPERPATAASAEELAVVEADLPVTDWVTAAVAARSVFQVRFEDALSAGDAEARPRLPSAGRATR